MDDLARKVERAAHSVEVVWDPARQRRVQMRIERATAKMRWPRAVAFSLAGVAAMAVVAMAFWPQGPTRVANQVASRATAARHRSAPDPQPALLLGNGSQVQALAPETRWVLERAEREHTALRLERGAARFDVTPSADRVFVVLAGPAEVRVMGTVFRVVMGSEAVTVAVEHGHVEVRVFDRTHTLSAGDEASFPLTPPVDTLATPGAATDEERDGDGHAARVRAAPRWDVLARDGDYEQAYVRLTQQGNRGVNDSPGELLLAADTARLTGHAARAVGYLERFLGRYPTDPRAALTAFTLGRVHLQELGQPSKAAAAFALVRSLAPAGELAEDALAREVESWSRAGRAREALSLAEEYVRKYPRGRRLHMVRRLGGL